MASAGRAALLLGFLVGLNGASTSALAVAIPRMAADYEVPGSIAAWSVSTYVIALAVATPSFGRLANAWGIRVPFVLGIVLIAGGSAVAAIAPEFGLHVAARIAQGTGAGAIQVLVVALVAEVWRGQERAVALARVAGVGVTVSSLGPLAGGGLEALGGWRLTVALPVIAITAVPVLLRLAPADGTRQRMDRVGWFLVAATAAGIVLLLQSPGVGPTVAVIGGAVAVIAAPLLVVWVVRRPTGFLPRDLITNTTVLRSAFAAAAIPASWFALILAVPLATGPWGWTPQATGLLLLPATIAGVGAPSLSRALLPRLGPRRCMAVANPISIMALTSGACGAVLASSALLAVAVVLVTIAFGIGQPAMIAAVSAAVPVRQRGVALGVSSLIFLTGGSVGAALIGGLASDAGIAAPLVLLFILPVLGLLALSSGGPDRVAVKVPET